ncbi:IS66 Orf2 family protein, partial [Citreicella sp. 357]
GLEAGKFIWPSSGTGEAVQISAAQLGCLLEGMDWRNPRWTQRPTKAGQNPAKLHILSGVSPARGMLRACPIPPPRWPDCALPWWRRKPVPRPPRASWRRPGRWSRPPRP